MVYDGNRSRDRSAFTTQIGTEDNCDAEAGSARAGTGGSGYRDGDTGKAVSAFGRGETIVPESSDETAANPGRLPTPKPDFWTPELLPPGEQPDWTMQPGEQQTDVGSLLA